MTDKEKIKELNAQVKQLEKDKEKAEKLADKRASDIEAQKETIDGLREDKKALENSLKNTEKMEADNNKEMLIQVERALKQLVDENGRYEYDKDTPVIKFKETNDTFEGVYLYTILKNPDKLSGSKLNDAIIDGKAKVYHAFMSNNAELNYLENTVELMTTLTRIKSNVKRLNIRYSGNKNRKGQKMLIIK